MAERVRPGPSGWSNPSTWRVPCTASRTSSTSTGPPSPFRLPRLLTQRSAASGQTYTSPRTVPSGCGSANAITSVSPRRPVARRFRRRMAALPSSVSSTRACGAPSQASTRRATRARRASSLGRRLPRRGDAATGFRVVDAVVVHPADDADELLLHLLQLLQRHRRLVELPLAVFGPYDGVVHFVDLGRREILEHPKRRFHRVGQHRDGGLRGARLGTRVGVIGRLQAASVAALLGAVEEVGDLRRA